jgi:two-component system chemotaxis response regulator CheB
MDSVKDAQVVGRAVRVLVVDDSAYVRKIVKEMLSRGDGIDVVGTARDGEEALEMVEALQPDVVTSDLIMPAVDGVEFIRRQMARKPVPIIVVSIAAEASEMVLAALDAGAIDFVQKPTALATEKVFAIAEELVAKVTAAARAPLAAVGRLSGGTVAPVRRRVFANRFDMVVIGTSTGGPQGLKAVIPPLPADFPVPVAIVLHMPIGYTEGYAKRLDEVSALTVAEARDGEPVRAGGVYLAPAGQHLSFRRDSAGHVVASLDIRPLDTPHRPSVDVLFQSAADTFGDRVLAVVMTGMGSDGREGAAWVKARGGCVLTEAQDTCVVYGMPRSVVEAGLSDAAVPLTLLADAILERS